MEQPELVMKFLTVLGALLKEVSQTSPEVRRTSSEVP